MVCVRVCVCACACLCLCEGYTSVDTACFNPPNMAIVNSTFALCNRFARRRSTYSLFTVHDSRSTIHVSNQHKSDSAASHSLSHSFTLRFVRVYLWCQLTIRRLDFACLLASSHHPSPSPSPSPSPQLHPLQHRHNLILDHLGSFPSPSSRRRRVVIPFVSLAPLLDPFHSQIASSSFSHPQPSELPSSSPGRL